MEPRIVGITRSGGVMRSVKHSRSSARFLGGLMAMVFTIVFLAATASSTRGGDHAWGSIFHTHFGHEEVPPGQIATLNGGAWYWMRSPEQEKTVVMNLFNRYCIRCHGVDGRGVWDIPGIPDFTDVRWQNYRSDADIVRIIIEGRGAVMPQFRGALALDEAWGLAHYLRTFRARDADVQAGAPQSSRTARRRPAPPRLRRHRRHPPVRRPRRPLRLPRPVVRSFPRPSRSAIPRAPLPAERIAVDREIQTIVACLPQPGRFLGGTGPGFLLPHDPGGTEDSRSS